MPSKFDLAVFYSKSEAGMAGTWIYNCDLFDARTISKIASHFQSVLETVTEKDADPKLSEIQRGLHDAEQQLRAIEKKAFNEVSLDKLRNIKRRPGSGSEARRSDT
jgi:non-ribosomal peptide synthetase component F